MIPPPTKVIAEEQEAPATVTHTLKFDWDGCKKFYNLQPGDRVDVLLREKSPNGEDQTKVILHNIRVWEATTRQGRDAQGQAGLLLGS